MSPKLTIAIPTYRREEVLIETIEAIVANRKQIEKILILDQTAVHEPAVERRLEDLEAKGEIQWERMSSPSIPRAMNLALLRARSKIVLFLDDDIIPCNELAEVHIKSYDIREDIWAVAGRVIQPWQMVPQPAPGVKNHGSSNQFDFRSSTLAYVTDAMAGNLSVLREKAIEIGGFDENFKGAAYRFETEFAERLIEHGGKILFQPAASIEHLQSKKGGVRSFGDSRQTVMPYHSVGAYYYFFRSKKTNHAFWKCLKRFGRSIYTRHHLSKPWWIPITLIAEMWGFLWAILLASKRPSRLQS